ncbi:MAG TPA: hypothetical protein VLK25_11705 [Allosphingosinicella sp.]|nr:hypothetical protein [Allosphingosinicella sp.]
MEKLDQLRQLDPVTQIIVISLLNLIMIPAAWRIMKRAGMNPRFSLVAAVPLLGYLLLVAILAFSTWPTEPEGYR